MSTDDQHISRGDQAGRLCVGYALFFLTVLLVNRYALHHDWSSAATDALALSAIYAIGSIVAIVTTRRREARTRENK